MIKSMTGFAALTQEDERVTIGVTLRSVNHRYLDVQLRAPQWLSQMEPRLRAQVQRHAARGRIELAVSVQLRQEPVLTVELNETFVNALGHAMDRARERGLIEGTLTPGDLVKFPQALTVRELPVELDPENSRTVEDSVEGAVERALAELDRMRRAEGAHLQVDLDGRKAAVAEMVERVAAAAVEGAAALQARLAERVAELTGDLQVDRNAIPQEIVRFAAADPTSARRSPGFARTCRSGPRSRRARNPVAGSWTSSFRR